MTVPIQLAGDNLTSSKANVVAQQVLQRLVQQFYSTAKQQFIPVFLTTPIWGTIFYLEHRKTSILIWIVVTMTMQVVRLLMNLRYQRMPHTHAQPERWERQALWVVTASALTYAAAPWVLFVDGNLTYNALMMLWCLGLLAAATPALSAMKRAMLSFGSITGFSLALCMATGTGFINVASAFGSAIATVVFIWFGLQTHRLQASALLLGLEKQALAEDLERQVQIALRANLEKSRFLAAASHDLRQPLHALTLFGSVLQGKFASTVHAPEFDRLMQSVNALNESLHAMLDISRLDAGVVPIQMQAVQLDSLFAKLRQTYFERAEQKMLSLRFRTCHLVVQADPHLLMRLLGNLVDNAIKHSTTGGILVTARLRLNHDTNEIKIEVRDAGPGISPEYHQCIFDEFFQIENPARDRTQGLGIGLSIVKRLVAAQDMRLTLRSMPGCGTTFVLHAKQAPPSAINSMPSCDPKLEKIDALAVDTGQILAGKHFLVIDDELVVLEALSSLLCSFGAEVTTAASAEQALQQTTSTTVFNAMILDYRLGSGPTGLVLAQDIRGRLSYKLPYVLVTGDTNPEQIATMQASGAVVRFKPLNAEALLAAISEAMA